MHQSEPQMNDFEYLALFFLRLTGKGREEH